jgi:hypothetical protein
MWLPPVKSCAISRIVNRPQRMAGLISAAICANRACKREGQDQRQSELGLIVTGGNVDLGVFANVLLNGTLG